MTLKELFTNIANAIRSATGTTGKIKASDFATKINAITYRGAWGTTINAGGSVTIPSGYHNGSGKVSANGGSNPTIKYKNSVSSNKVAKLSYTFDSNGTYRVLATGTIRAYHGGLIEFYTNGSISSTYYSNTWSKGNGVYGGQAEGADRTTIVFFGDIVARTGNSVSVGSVEDMDCFFTLCVEKLNY